MSELESQLESLFGTKHPVALVTGSGSPRLGNAIVRDLAARGYEVAIHANNSIDHANQTANELNSAGCRAFVVQGDVSIAQDVDRIVDEVIVRLGRIDALVNCASIWKPKRLEDVTSDDVRRNLEVNTLGTFLCCQKAGLVMASQTTGGAIVNFGDWAIARPYMDYSAYFPSKGAIATITRDLAVELASRNPRVRVNAIQPGPCMIPGQESEAKQQAAVDGTLVKLPGSPKFISAAVVFLLEHSFITGITLPVDGGTSISPPS